MAHSRRMEYLHKEDLLASLLRGLVGQLVDVGVVEKTDEYSYGVEYRNDVFQIHPDCLCERDDCPWCAWEHTERFVEYGAEPEAELVAPNFWHFESGLKVWWCKYIGRGMETNIDLSEMSVGELTRIMYECMKSVEKQDLPGNK